MGNQNYSRMIWELVGEMLLLDIARRPDAFTLLVKIEDRWRAAGEPNFGQNIVENNG